MSQATEARVMATLRVLVAVMLVGAARTAQLHGSPISSVLWHDFGWSEPAFTGVDRGVAYVLYATAALVLVLRGRALAWAIGPALLWLVLVPLAKLRAGGDFGYLLAPLSKGNRPLALLALALWATARPRAHTLLRAGVVIVFTAHGLEALLQHPQFVDYLIVTLDRIGPVRPTEAAAHVMLVGIGAIDLAVAAVLARRLDRRALAWACLWGFVTASMRLIYFGPVDGAHHAAIRALNGGGALVLLLARAGAPARGSAASKVSHGHLARG